MVMPYARMLTLSLMGVYLTAVVAGQAMRVVMPEGLSKYWILADRSITADVPNTGRGLNEPSCAAVSYIIEKNGTPGQVKLQRVVPEGDLGKVAVSVVTHLHYRSSDQNPERNPVFTYLIVPFNLPEATELIAGDKTRVDAQREQIVAACRLDQLKPENVP